MNDSFHEIAFLFLKHRIPLFFSLLLVILFSMPLDVYALNGYRPQVSVICLYYWAEKRPNMFGLVSAFILGLLVDVCNTAPLGINCLLSMVFLWLCTKVFYYVKPVSFTMDWFMFAVAGIVFMFCKWLVFMAYYGAYLQLSDIFSNTFSTIMFYPLIAYINNKILLNLLPQERINE